MPNEPPNPSVSPEALTRKHESQNPALRWILITAGLVTITVVICLGVVWLMMRSLAKTHPPPPWSEDLGTITSPSEALLQRFPAPSLQLIPHQDLVALQARENEQLNSYGWIDRTGRVVHIPIGRAMELIAERGLPTRATNAPPQTGKSKQELIQERWERK
jgi:hypothetical protein